MKPKSLPSKTNGHLVKVESLKKFAPLPKEVRASLAKNFKAAVVLDKNGGPKLFIFDPYSLWDLLCVADARYEKTAPAKEYIHNNALGWIIDAIEEKLPINPELVRRLKRDFDQAKRRGYISWDKLKRELGLV